MGACSPTPRTIDAGLDWFLSHNPSGSGMCAQHTWHSLGGNNGCPPAWGCSNANQVYDKVIASDRYWTNPKRGDIIVWRYGNNGHAARVYNEAGTQIATTDPSSGMVGVEDINYPSKWGASSSARICTDTYNGILCFSSEPVDSGLPPEGTVESGIGFWDWYSKKSTDKVLVYPDGSWHDIKIAVQPASGITGKSKEEHFLYLRCHLPKGRSATRTIHTRFIRSNGDETAYMSPSWDASPGNDSVGYPNFHVESGSGLGGKWQILVEGGTDPIDYTTRYAKTYVTYREG